MQVLPQYGVRWGRPDGAGATPTISFAPISFARCPVCAIAACVLLMPLLCAAQQPDTAGSAKAKDHGQTTAGKPAPPADTPPQAPSAKPDAASDNPFPEDVSRGAAAKAKDAENPDAPAPAGDAGAGSSSSSDSSSSSSSADSSSSSSSNSDSSSADAKGGDPNAEPDVPAREHRRRLGKPSSKDIQSGSLAGEGRAEEDVRVGSYYLSQHNYAGAYTRFEEAARLDPANVEAIYGVASSAEGLHKTDEALENYKLYLQIAPDGEHAQLAERSLKSLSK
jgi:hypothetical protein